jgi:ribosomal protein L44E
MKQSGYSRQTKPIFQKKAKTTKKLYWGFSVLSPTTDLKNAGY